MTSTKILAIHKKLAKTNLPELKSGMKVKVWYKVKEKDKWRTTYFEGIIIAVKHGQKTLNGTFTVRRISINDVGVEMTWPLHSPVIEKIQILQTSKTRRAKLYYIRERSRKQIKAKLKTAVTQKTAEQPKEQEASNQTQEQEK
ncbi:MAG: 50S ribosomal protein L19 [Patescibacteria group bacterium]